MAPARVKNVTFDMCNVLLCYAMLCHIMLFYAMLCRVLQCYVMSYYKLCYNMTTSCCGFIFMISIIDDV